MKKSLPVLTWNGRILLDKEEEDRLSGTSSSVGDFEVISLKDLLSMGEEELRNQKLPAKERGV